MRGNTSVVHGILLILKTSQFPKKFTDETESMFQQAAGASRHTNIPYFVPAANALCQPLFCGRRIIRDRRAHRRCGLAQRSYQR
jgi:hypothetical protein